MDVGVIIYVWKCELYDWNGARYELNFDLYGWSGGRWFIWKGRCFTQTEGCLCGVKCIICFECWFRWMTWLLHEWNDGTMKRWNRVFSE